MNKFNVGQVVCLKSDSSKRGAVTAVTDDGVYSVFMDECSAKN